MLGFFGPFYEKLNSLVWKQQNQLAFDRIDQLNAWLTPILLSGLTLAISCKQYFGHPLKCWTPREFSGSWDSYVHDYCFIENTYFKSNTTEISEDASGIRQINYYRWVPFVLLCQAFFFAVPYIIWNMAHKKTYINLKETLRYYDKLYKANDPAEACEYFVNEVSLKLNKIRYSNKMIARCGATLCYFMLKLTYIINILMQLYVIQKFLNVDSYFWGFSHFWNIEFNGTGEFFDSIFPRVVHCDFTIRNLGQPQRHTVTCVIMLNMINEKLYVSFYFWLMFLLFSTVISTVHFCYQLFFKAQSLIPTSLTKKPSMSLQRAHIFIRKYLTTDGVLLLTFLDGQFGSFQLSQVVDLLIERFLSEHQSDSSINSETHSSFRYAEFNQDTLPVHKLSSKNTNLLDDYNNRCETDSHKRS